VNETNLNLDQAKKQAEERLKSIEPQVPVDFHFSWRKINFTGLVDKDEQGTVLRLCGDLCPVPFTSESKAERQHLMSLLRWSDHGNRIRFASSESKRFLLLAETHFEEPLTAGSIMTAVAAFLLRLRPYFHLARNLERAAASAAGQPAR
jgi:hypothetical protein